MTLFASIRRKQTSWTRRVLGLFVVAWLGVALQPCAMALGGDAGDCPHCPPAHEAHMSEHGAHQGMPETAPCAGGANGCESLGQYDYDGRTFDLKLKDPPAELPIAVLPFAEGLPLRRSLVPCGRVDHSSPPGVPPPLNVLYCVYLN